MTPATHLYHQRKLMARYTHHDLQPSHRLAIQVSPGVDDITMAPGCMHWAVRASCSYVLVWSFSYGYPYLPLVAR